MTPNDFPTPAAFKTRLRAGRGNYAHVLSSQFPYGSLLCLERSKGMDEFLGRPEHDGDPSPVLIGVRDCAEVLDAPDVAAEAATDQWQRYSLRCRHLRVFRMNHKR